MSRARPMPHAPLSRSAPAMIAGLQPPATGMPFSGSTTNSATMLGSSAPSTSARSQYAPPVAFRSNGQSAAPQTPPQNASEITAGTPNGPVGAMLYGVRGNAPESQSRVSMP